MSSEGRSNTLVVPAETPSEHTPLLANDASNVPITDQLPALVRSDEEEVTIIQSEISTTKLYFILGTSYVGVFLGAIDGTVFATLSGEISSEFKSLSLMSWLATAYLIANAAFQPISGRMTDLFGRGPGLVVSNLLFAIGNLICGLAHNDGVMILGRVIAGIGGGGLMSISTFIGSDLIPLRKRGVFQGVGNVAYGSGAMLGGVFGGFINEKTALGWRLAFLVQVPVVLVSAALCFALIRLPPKISNRSLISRIDFTGVALTISFLVLLLLGLNAGGNLVPWSHPLVLTTIPLAIVMFVGFIWWESRTPQPVIPVHLLVDRTILTACFTNLFCSMALFMEIFYIPLYMQVLDYTTADAGLRLIGTPIGTALSSVVAGYFMKNTGKYVRLGITVLLIKVAGLAVICTLGMGSNSWTPMAGLLMVGTGYGAMLTITMVACVAAVDHSQQAVVTSATYAFRSIGSTLGITIASAIYQNELRKGLWQRFGHLPGAAEEIARIRDDLGELKRLPEGWKDGVTASFMEAFSGVWYMALSLGLLALVCISLMRQHTLHDTLARK